MFGAAPAPGSTGRLVARNGRYRAWPIIGSVLMTLAALLLVSLDRSSPVVLAGATVLLLGTGAGFVMQPSLLAAQNAAAAARPRHGHLHGAPVPHPRQHDRHPDLRRHAQRRPRGGGPHPGNVADALRPVFTGAVVVGLASIAISLALPDRPLRERIDPLDPELAPAPP